MDNERFPNMFDGRKTVTTPATAERLVAASTPCKKVTIMAELDNTDYVVVGGSTVVAAVGTRRGIPLGPGTPVTLYVNDLYDVWIDAVVATEGVTFLYQY